jgi:ubiquitin carboxyl-terminal hydrolase 48
MYDNALNGNTTLLEDVPCAIMASQFVRAWRQWLGRPSENVRPDTIDNSAFLFEHDKLVFDPNCPTDLDSSVAFVKRADWDVLEAL